MRKIILAAFGLLALAAGAIVTMPDARAYSHCTTSCYGNTCYTNCY